MAANHEEELLAYQNQKPTLKENPRLESSRHNDLSRTDEFAQAHTYRQTTCDRCRLRKNRCDGQKPSCRPCALAAHPCTYDVVRWEDDPRDNYFKFGDWMKDVEPQLKENWKFESSTHNEPPDADEADQENTYRRLACDVCRKRKLRCDGQQPACGTCVRLGHECMYYEVRRKGGPRRGYVKALEARLKDVESQLKSKQTAMPVEPPIDAGEHSQPRRSPTPTNLDLAYRTGALDLDSWISNQAADKRIAKQETKSIQDETSFRESSSPSDASVNQIDESSSLFAKELGLQIANRFIELNGFPVSCAPSEQAPSSTSQSNSTYTSSTSPASSSKRQHSAGDFAEEDDEHFVETFLRPKRRRKDSKTIRLFACPYCKLMPERYSERNQDEQNYRRCISIKLDSITRLKQHLKRVHSRPSFYCGICFAVFGTREQFFEHQRRVPPCHPGPTRFEEKMTDEQCDLIKVRRFDNSRASWYEIFRILFPGTPEPDSPYVTISDPTSFNKFVEFFRWYGPDEMLNLVRERRDDPEQRLEMSASLQMLIAETFGVFEQTLSIPEEHPELQQRQSDGEHRESVPQSLEANFAQPNISLPSPLDATESTDLSFHLDHVDSAFEEFVNSISYSAYGNSGDFF